MYTSPCGAGFAATPTLSFAVIPFKIHQQRCNTRRCQNSFSVQVVPHSNKLSEKIANTSSVEVLKVILDTRWHSPFSEVPV